MFVLDFDTVALSHSIHIFPTHDSSWNCTFSLSFGLHLFFLGVRLDYTSQAALQLGVATWQFWPMESEKQWAPLLHKNFRS